MAGAKALGKTKAGCVGCGACYMMITTINELQERAFLLTPRAVRIDYSTGPGPIIITLSGQLDSTTASSLQVALQGLCADGHRCFILACAELNYLSSAGLRVLMSVRKALAKDRDDGGIHLAEARAHVRDVFQISGLDGIFPMHTTLEAARSAAGGVS